MSCQKKKLVTPALMKKMKSTLNKSVRIDRELGGFVTQMQNGRVEATEQKGSRSHIMMVPPMDRKFDGMYHTHPFSVQHPGKPPAFIVKKIKEFLIKDNTKNASQLLNTNIIKLHPPSPDDIRSHIFMSKIYKKFPSMIVTYEGIYVIHPESTSMHTGKTYENSHASQESLIDAYYKSIWGVSHKEERKLKDGTTKQRLQIISKIQKYVSETGDLPRIRKYQNFVEKHFHRKIDFHPFLKNSKPVIV